MNMSSPERIVYVDGQYCPESEGKVSIFDRGYLFADAIYEVTCIIGGKLVDFDGHMIRLARSLKELDMPMPMSTEELLAVHRKLVADNNVEEGLIYMQISRGNADRDFNFPSKDTPPVVVMFTQARPVLESPLAKRGLKVISLPDIAGAAVTSRRSSFSIRQWRRMRPMRPGPTMPGWCRTGWSPKPRQPMPISSLPTVKSSRAACRPISCMA